MNKPDSTASGVVTARVLVKVPARAKLKDSLYKVSTAVHREVFRASKGRIFGRTFGMPVAELVTTGRSSGKERSTMLAVPITDGDRLVLVASFGGDDRHPAWYLNLTANPEVRATIAGSTRAMIARTATEEERESLWPRITAVFDGYARYQERTKRSIPVIVLEPVSAGRVVRTDGSRPVHQASLCRAMLGSSSQRSFTMKATKPTTETLVNRTALSIVGAWGLTTIHHVYGGIVDGATNRLRVPFIMAAPSLVALGALRRYRRSRGGAALATAAVAGVGAWVLLSGILHGGYAHVYKDALFLLDGPPGLYHPLNPDEHYPPDDLFFEVTGALETASAFFVALYTYRLLRDRRAGAGAE